MLTFLKKYKHIWIILSFPYVYFLFVLVMPTQKQVLAPGGLTPVEESIQIEGIDFVEQFYTIYVYNYYPMTPFQGFVAGVNEKMEVYPLSVRQKDTSLRDDYLSGQVSKLSSLQNSIIQAYLLASETDDEIVIDYHFGGLMISYRPSRIKELSIGDIVLSVNGVSYSDSTEAEFLTLASQKEVTLEVKKRDRDEVIFVSYELDDAEPDLRFYTHYEIERATPSFELPGLNSVIGGPSGGMMQTLSIYVSLLKVNIGQLEIAGTGTINSDGTIGEIGGIRQKIYTAEDENIDIFFIPKAHLSDITNIQHSFILIPVETIEEAVQGLYEVIN
ncbi:MAG: S16 family serine protease [Acholeplasmataceae bacterium]|nr:S16 family serine protease [Acholeplasmataceae bacterium]